MNPVWNHHRRHAYALECLEACTGTCASGKAVRRRFRVRWVEVILEMGYCFLVASFVVVWVMDLT